MERSFGVRAACCRFLSASWLAAISTNDLIGICIHSQSVRVPASKLAEAKAAASCTHYKALLRKPVEKCPPVRLWLLPAMDFLTFLMTITGAAAVKVSTRQLFDVNLLDEDCLAS